MGRQLYRVPLDFDHPIGKTWTGFLLPEAFHFPQCHRCEGTGYSPEARAISETFYPHQIDGPNAKRLAWHDKLGQSEVDYLLSEGRLSTWRDGALHQDPRTAADVNATNRRPGVDSHDGINRTLLIRFRCERLGIEQHCPHCDGHGDVATQAQRDEADAWESTPPPDGVGYQMWENTSEGSPISPVFETPEQLARWLADTRASAMGASTASYADWLATINAGSAMSMVLSNGELMSGVEFEGRT